jgi:hypothetical protein
MCCGLTAGQVSHSDATLGGICPVSDLKFGRVFDWIRQGICSKGSSSWTGILIMSEVHRLLLVFTKEESHYCYELKSDTWELVICLLSHTWHDICDRLADCWSWFNSSLHLFMTTMKHDRFFHIIQFLHFSNNDSAADKNDPNYDTGNWEMLLNSWMMHTHSLRSFRIFGCRRSYSTFPRRSYSTFPRNGNIQTIYRQEWQTFWNKN